MIVLVAVVRVEHILLNVPRRDQAIDFDPHQKISCGAEAVEQRGPRAQQSIER